MSKKNKVRTACAVCKESAAPSVSGRIKAINEEANKLERLSQTGNFTSLPRLVGTIARNLNRDRQGERMQEELASLAKSFSNAVAILHNVIFDREAASLFALRNGYEKWTPLTQCLCTASSQSEQYRLKVELLSLIHAAADIESVVPDLTRSALADALLQAFEMPDLPELKDPESARCFISASVSELDKHVKLLCEARPEPFLATIHQFANCAATSAP